MNAKSRTWAVVVAAAVSVIVVVVAGCSSKRSEPESSGATSQAAPRTPAAGGGAEQAMPPDMVMPAGTISEMWSQVAGEQTKLSSAIQNGQLKDVHHLAFGIRDLVVALTDKAKAASPGIAPKLDGMVEQVKASATKLDELGDAGNLSGTQAEYAKLETVLGAIKAITGGK